MRECWIIYNGEIWYLFWNITIDFGVENRVSCDFASSEEIEKHVGDLVTQADQINSMANKIWNFQWI